MLSVYVSMCIILRMCSGRSYHVYIGAVRQSYLLCDNLHKPFHVRDIILIDEGFDEEEVASEDADCHDDLSATLPVDLESDEVVHIWEHPILQCYGD